MKDRCEKSDERQEFMDHVKCLLPREKMEPLNICSDKHLVMMETVKDMPAEDRMPATCCIFFKFKECILAKTKGICGDVTSDYWDDVLAEIVI